jgi:hypothetical protein
MITANSSPPDQLVLGRRLHRQVGWFLALEDAIDVDCGAAELVDDVISVRDQAAISDVKPSVIDRRQFVSLRKGDDEFAMAQ